MKPTIDWNYERYRTRDLLLKLNNTILPPCPQPTETQWKDINADLIPLLPIIFEDDEE